MLKNIFLAATLTVLSSASFADDVLEKRVSVDEAKANFTICEAADSSWMRRWGNYVAGYDLNDTNDICRKKAWPQTNVSASQLGCRINGKFAIAGYYCKSK